MRNRTWSDLALAVMIGLCVAIVADSQTPQTRAPATASAQANVSEAARSLAVSVLLDSRRSAKDGHVELSRSPTLATPSAAERAVANAAEAAGNAARGIEMPFFSFGGDASAE